MKNKLIKQIGVVVMSMLIVSSLTRCSRRPTKKGADKFVAQIAPTEKYEAIDSTGNNDEIEVTYSSKDRDLIFQFNDEEWMTENLILTIMVRSEDDYKNNVTIKINGLNSLEDIKNVLDDLDI